MGWPSGKSLKDKNPKTCKELVQAMIAMLLGFKYQVTFATKCCWIRWLSFENGRGMHMLAQTFMDIKKNVCSFVLSSDFFFIIFHLCTIMNLNSKFHQFYEGSL